MINRDEDTLKQAMGYSYRLLAIKDRSKAEIKKKLLEKGFDSSIADEVILRLIRSGYIDDHRLAERLLKKAIKEKHYGKHTIKPYLLSKGIDEDTIERLELKGDEMIESALDFVNKRIKTIKNLNTIDVERKLFLMLKRRGHDTDTIKNVLENARRHHV